MKKFLVVLVFLLVLEACKAQAPTDSLPLNTKIPAVVVPTLTPLSTVASPAISVLSEDFLKISSLDPGPYFGFVETSSNKFYLSLASLSGVYQGQLTEIRGGYGLAISPDKHLLADLPYIVDLDMGIPEFYEELVNCTQPNWSPNSKELAVSCPSDDYHHEDIHIFSIQDRRKIPVTNCENEAFSCSVPLWSPDGRWLAFYRALGGSGTSQLTGLQILDMTCSSGLANCWRDKSGVDTYPSFSWSPDSQLLASVENDNVLVFQIVDGKLSLLESHKVNGVVDWIAWLGNNSELLVLEYSGKGGYVVSRETGSISPLTEAQEEFFRSQYHDSMFMLILP